ncbi:hypothetical protein HPB47_010712 [Ixodes persulcatus]|uniref:Uncharacterized protein n=1 Tax=Ixodes persulcatus TaxID=34615 RepID=A0AC60NYK3_IXOPE|nr:hypothetical protein HPB47_010712 [Ixodes persulcatus]
MAVSGSIPPAKFGSGLAEAASPGQTGLGYDDPAVTPQRDPGYDRPEQLAYASLAYGKDDPQPCRPVPGFTPERMSCGAKVSVPSAMLDSRPRQLQLPLAPRSMATSSTTSSTTSSSTSGTNGGGLLPYRRRSSATSSETCGRVVRLLTPTELVDSWYRDCGPRLLLVDCRPFLSFNAGRIKSAVNVNCGDRITRRRLQQGRLALWDLVACGQAREQLRRARDIVVYDDCTGDLECPQPSSSLSLVLAVLCQNGAKPAVLKGAHTARYNRPSRRR